MDILEAARLTGKAVQEDKRYKSFMEALKKVDSNHELQSKINEFNLRRQAYQYSAKTTPDNPDLKIAEKEIDKLYNEIVNSDDMKEYESKKSEVSKMLNSIMSVVNQCAGGADPETCFPEEIANCEGSCDSCSGC